MPSLRFKILTTVLWAPITWVPVTIASFGAMVLNFPWWVNVVTYPLAVAGPAIFWAAQVPRLAELWKLETTDHQLRAKRVGEDTLVGELHRTGYTLGHGTLSEAYRIERELTALYAEKPWLSQFPFLPDATSLVDDLERAMSDTLEQLKGSADRKALIRQRTEADSEPFALSLQALEDTLKTCRHTLESTDAGHLFSPTRRAGTAALDILERNKAARKAIKHLRNDNPGVTE